MSYRPSNWYDELYRIFSGKTLMTVSQTVKLGEVMKSIQIGENPIYHLNELYQSIKENKPLAEKLDEFIHAYLSANNENEEEEQNEKDFKPTFSGYKFIGN